MSEEYPDISLFLLAETASYVIPCGKCPIYYLNKNYIETAEEKLWHQHFVCFLNSEYLTSQAE